MSDKQESRRRLVATYTLPRSLTDVVEARAGRLSAGNRSEQVRADLGAFYALLDAADAVLRRQEFSADELAAVADAVGGLDRSRGARALAPLLEAADQPELAARVAQLSDMERLALIEWSATRGAL